jgi:imidazolonepropionase-like amidohydrolase
MSFKIKLILFTLTVCCCAAINISFATEEHPRQTLFINVRVWDGTSNDVSKVTDLLVENNIISQISSRVISTNDDATIIDGNGGVLMPGLIDTHTHISMRVPDRENSTPYDLAIASTLEARAALMDGFTTLREAGGPSFATKRFIDQGLIPGPRVYPAGAFISQTSGHADLRARNDRNFTLYGVQDSNMERMGVVIIVDGVDRVLAATRQNLMQGATHIKLMGGGGGASPYDPIDTTQYTVAEWKAAVDAASDWGTYVTAHLFYPKAIRRAINAGVKSLEHAFFADEETVKFITDNGVFISMNSWALSPLLFQHPSVVKSKFPAIRKAQAEAKNFVPWLKKNKTKVTFGSDGDTKARRYELYWRAQLFGSNVEVLKHATSVAAELVALSGPRNPYPGKLGVIEEGALADLLIIDGNPLEDISLVGGDENWFYEGDPKPVDSIMVIMKDGEIFKNSLGSQ